MDLARHALHGCSLLTTRLWPPHSQPYVRLVTSGQDRDSLQLVMPAILGGELFHLLEEYGAMEVRPRAARMPRPLWWWRRGCGLRRLTACASSRG